MAKEPELTPDDLAAMDERFEQYMRRCIERGEVLYDAQRHEYYNDITGMVLGTECQTLFSRWRSEGVIEVINPHMHRNCKVRMQ